MGCTFGVSSWPKAAFPLHGRWGYAILKVAPAYPYPTGGKFHALVHLGSLFRVHVPAAACGGPADSVFCQVERALIWLSVPITVAVDALVWGPAVIHGGSYSAIALVFLVPQVLVVTAISFLIARRWANRAK